MLRPERRGQCRLVARERQPPFRELLGLPLLARVESLLADVRIAIRTDAIEDSACQRPKILCRLFRGFSSLLLDLRLPSLLRELTIPKMYSIGRLEECTVEGIRKKESQIYIIHYPRYRPYLPVTDASTNQLSESVLKYSTKCRLLVHLQKCHWYLT